nr:hypothetical protein [Kibdelosporangium sp. MJ126-NF4]
MVKAVADTALMRVGSPSIPETFDIQYHDRVMPRCVRVAHVARLSWCSRHSMKTLKAWQESTHR